MLLFWAAALPVAALLGFPWTYLTKDINFLYRMCMFALATGARIAGVKVRTLGLEKIDPARTYIFMSNHISNLDPPLTLPLIPRRTSVMVKKELFKVPILGQIMTLGSLVPVDRGNRDAGISAVRDAVKAIEQGLNMSIYVEGHRSFDGKLLPFKKGPFYLAEECKVPVVPITISGTEACHAESALCDSTGNSDRAIPRSDRARGFRRPRLPDGPSASGHQQRPSRGLAGNGAEKLTW
jgi:1-acyl-sn-glycerol-3-phosphate acyltransferase